jgi:glycosyltransferase involved in cell wall biosynthesis
MKIALLSEKYTPEAGGLAISAARLARLLSAAGHQVRVFAPTVGLPPSETRTLVHDGVRVDRFGAHKRIDDTLVDWFELIVREHQRETFDLLHAYFLTQAGYIAAYAGNYLGLPSVVSARGNDLERGAFDPGRAAHILFALQNAGAVTANAHELARKARALVPGMQVTIVPNGIDAEHFSPMPRNQKLAEGIGLTTKGTKGHNRISVVGFVGELREKKGLQTLLAGYTQVAKIIPSALLIVGEVRVGEDQRIFQEFQTANPDPKIIVTGHVSPSDLPSYYALMDLFLHPSMRDGLPNAMLEAMACARPVVATAVGGIVDAITDRANGRLVPPADAAALAAVTLELLEDKSTATEYGRCARETVVEKFTLQAELDGYLQVYRNLGVAK